METIIIISLGVMLIIALLKLRSNEVLLQTLTNKLNAEGNANIYNVKKQKELQKQIETLKNKTQLLDKALKKAKGRVFKIYSSAKR